jgi:hypothetical protein
VGLLPKIFPNDFGDSSMWNVSVDQAVEMYARFCQARYGAKAIEIAERKVSELRDAGDAEGERVWTKVKRALERPTPH